MKFPEQLSIRVIDADSGKAVPGIALTIKLFARQKNDYTIALLTDLDGQVIVTADQVRKEIAQDWELFPMDYSSSLEDCFSMSEVATYAGEDLQRLGKAMRLYQDSTGRSDEEIQAFEKAVNGQYIPAKKRFDVEREDHLTIPVLRRE